MERNAVRTLRLLAMLVAAVALLIPATAAAHSHGKRHHQSGHHGKHQGRDHGNQAAPNALYTTTNDPNGNQVITYARHADGTITQTGPLVSTGGKGIASEPPFGFPIVDSSGSTNITPDGKLLFVVNAGSNSVTSFRVTSSG